MNITVKTNDEQVFQGEDAKVIVRAMKNAQWNAPDTKREYMEQAAERVRQMTGQRPREDAVGFLTDLQTAGLVTITLGDATGDTLQGWLTGGAEA